MKKDDVTLKFYDDGKSTVETMRATLKRALDEEQKHKERRQPLLMRLFRRTA